MSSPWTQWLRTAFERMGGTIAPSNGDITSQSATITALQTLTTTHTGQIMAINVAINDINQGTVL
jgi:hypothetical protein